jgi:hypothetical protein
LQAEAVPEARRRIEASDTLPSLADLAARAGYGRTISTAVSPPYRSDAPGPAPKA